MNFFELPLKNWDLFSSMTLRQGRIVLMSDLTPAIDFFNSSDVGIGARNVQQATAELNIPPAEQERLSRIMRLRSYDVYTLRAALAGHLNADEIDRMALPPGERKLLEKYTRDYTRALFRLIFEDKTIEVTDRHSMKELLQQTSEEMVRNNVLALAQKFQIKPEQLVDYIASIGDMLLAISFYRRTYEHARRDIESFLTQIRKVGEDKILKYRHVGIQRRVVFIYRLGQITLQVLDRYFESINRIGEIWETLTPEKFRALHDEMEQQYPKIGRILCIWQVKMQAWRGRFCDKEGRPKDSTMDQQATFFSDRIYPKFETIQDDLHTVKDLNQVFFGMEPEGGNDLGLGEGEGGAAS
ncbi:MAG TPA: hypothetical protein VEB64_04730 [Azospirillaceae bacterium]|nr:hypothetical protein [Azospirillaceae bacterium]